MAIATVPSRLLNCYVIIDFRRLSGSTNSARKTNWLGRTEPRKFKREILRNDVHLRDRIDRETQESLPFRERQRSRRFFWKNGRGMVVSEKSTVTMFGSGDRGRESWHRCSDKYVAATRFRGYKYERGGNGIEWYLIERSRVYKFEMSLQVCTSDDIFKRIWVGLFFEETMLLK